MRGEFSLHIKTLETVVDEINIVTDDTRFNVKMILKAGTFNLARKVNILTGGVIGLRLESTRDINLPTMISLDDGKTAVSFDGSLEDLTDALGVFNLLQDDIQRVIVLKMKNYAQIARNMAIFTGIPATLFPKSSSVIFGLPLETSSDLVLINLHTELRLIEPDPDKIVEYIELVTEAAKFAMRVKLKTEVDLKAQLGKINGILTGVRTDSTCDIDLALLQNINGVAVITIAGALNPEPLNYAIATISQDISRSIFTKITTEYIELAQQIMRLITVSCNRGESLDLDTASGGSKARGDGPSFP